MLLIDALYINNGGGKILLDYLISSIEESNIEVFYLLDERIRNKHPILDDKKVVFLKANFLRRHWFYLKNKSKFNSVLCFANLPPNILLHAKVYTYLHQTVYLNVPKEFSVKDKIKFFFKIAILKKIATNTNYWVVQSNLIKEKLSTRFLVPLQEIKVLPFYPQFNEIKIKVIRKENTYLYVSNATPHKNHKKLIRVFCEFYDKYQKGNLILTVANESQEISALIALKNKLGYPIENIGFVDRDTLQKVYLSSEFLIFPSLTESFGLGLIEAIECGCKVIGADLPYTYEVCEPSLVFDPSDDSSIFNAFEESINRNTLRATIPKINNNIKELITLLQQ